MISEIDILIKILTLIGMIGAPTITIMVYLNQKFKNQEKRIIDSITTSIAKMAEKSFVQTIASMQAREIIGMKRKMMPIVKTMQRYLKSKKILLNQSKSDYVGDSLHFSKLPEKEFLKEFKIFLKDD